MMGVYILDCQRTCPGPELVQRGVRAQAGSIKVQRPGRTAATEQSTVIGDLEARTEAHNFLRIFGSSTAVGMGKRYAIIGRGPQTSVPVASISRLVST